MVLSTFFLEQIHKNEMTESDFSFMTCCVLHEYSDHLNLFTFFMFQPQDLQCNVTDQEGELLGSRRKMIYGLGLIQFDVDRHGSVL